MQIFKYCFHQFSYKSILVLLFQVSLKLVVEKIVEESQIEMDKLLLLIGCSLLQNNFCFFEMLNAMNFSIFDFHQLLKEFLIIRTLCHKNHATKSSNCHNSTFQTLSLFSNF